MLKIKNLVKISLFTAVICIFSLIKIPLRPVCVSLTFFAVNTIILISDFKVSFAAVLLYLILGILGLPVFSQGGGIGYIFNMSFGYLLGFLASTFISEISKKKIKGKYLNKNLILSLINILTVYLFGAFYAYILSYFYMGVKMDIKYLLICYVLIFIPTDMLFGYFSSKIAERLKRIVK